MVVRRASPSAPPVSLSMSGNVQMGRFEIIVVVRISFPRRRRSACFDNDLLSRLVHGFWALEVGFLPAVVIWVDCCYNVVCGSGRPIVFLSSVSSIRGGHSMFWVSGHCPDLLRSTGVKVKVCLLRTVVTIISVSIRFLWLISDWFEILIIISVWCWIHCLERDI